MKIYTTDYDIIKLVQEEAIDCIVNPSNRELERGATLSGAIYDAAGLPALSPLAIACGSAIMTEGHDLCRYIIHTLAPTKHSASWASKLMSCYYSVMDIALNTPDIKTIAIPAIGTGAHQLWPSECRVYSNRVLESVVDANEGRLMNIILCYHHNEDGKHQYESQIAKGIEPYPLTTSDQP
jgi:O-acetyl-ADP-ribose deacetylase (regulator of RNase III)